MREWVASLMQLGISEADARAYVGAPPPPPAEFGVWPENWPAVQVFMAMQTQWRRNAMTGRREGLIYEALDRVMRWCGVAPEAEADCFSRVGVMERTALGVWAGRGR